MRKNSWAGKSLKVTAEKQTRGCVEGHMARPPTHLLRVPCQPSCTFKEESEILAGSADGLSSTELSDDVQSTVAGIVANMQPRAVRCQAPPT